MKWHKTIPVLFKDNKISELFLNLLFIMLPLTSENVPSATRNPSWSIPLWSIQLHYSLSKDLLYVFLKWDLCWFGYVYLYVIEVHLFYKTFIDHLEIQITFSTWSVVLRWTFPTLPDKNSVSWSSTCNRLGFLPIHLYYV